MHFIQCRKTECRCFTCTGMSLSYDVTPFHNNRNNHLLNRTWSFETGIIDTLHDLFSKTKRFKCYQVFVCDCFFYYVHNLPLYIRHRKTYFRPVTLAHSWGREILMRISWILIREGTLEKDSSISLEGTQNSNGMIAEYFIKYADSNTLTKDKDNL